MNTAWPGGTDLEEVPMLALVGWWLVAAESGEPTGLATVAVVDESGTPVSGALVTLSGRDGLRSLVTRADGVVRVEVPAGAFELAVDREGFRSWWDIVTVPSGGLTLEVEVAPQPPARTGSGDELTKDFLERLRTGQIPHLGGAAASEPDASGFPLEAIDPRLPTRRGDPDGIGFLPRVVRGPTCLEDARCPNVLAKLPGYRSVDPLGLLVLTTTPLDGSLPTVTLDDAYVHHPAMPPVPSTVRSGLPGVR